MKTDYLRRLDDPRMDYYRKLYKDSPKWNGEILKDKTIIIYCEQGMGDIIQMARYFRSVADKKCKIIIHAQEELKNLFLSQEYINGFIAKGETEIPKHDFHVLSLSLPFIFPKHKAKHPYIDVQEKNQEIEDEFKNAVKVGITWEGNSKSCELRYFKKLYDNPKVKLFMVQKEARDQELLNGCDNLELFGTEISDMLDTAKLIQAMDFLVAVDTCTLHLAGALNKKCYGLIEEKGGDPRWKAKIWYPSVKLLKVNKDNIKNAITAILRDANQ